jgi:hypothetical protein
LWNCGGALVYPASDGDDVGSIGASQRGAID